jgi:hypothetical protein
VTISSVVPGSAPAGAIVVLNGSGFTGVSSVKFSTASTTYVVDSPTRIRATVPSYAPNWYVGKWTVTAAAGSGQSANFTVIPQAKPTISSISPATGPPGTVITVTGTHFVNVSSVKIGGFGVAWTLVSVGEIQATVPGWAPPGSSGKVSVTTNKGTATSAASFTVT